VDLIDSLRREKALAPKSIYNVYSNLKALFRDAQLDDLIDSSPCILTKHQLGPNEDKNSEWRATAIYSRDEADLLISDARIPEDRHVLYALEMIGMLRHGEAAGLRFRHYDDTMKPLGRLVIATSYNKGRTKTGRTRYVPVHPTLAVSLADWKSRGRKKMMGRAPTPDDLIVPLPESRRVEIGAMRTKNHSFKRLRTDLKRLDLRHRRGHDLRRTGISRPYGRGQAGHPRAVHAQPGQGALDHRPVHHLPVGEPVRGGRQAEDPLAAPRGVRRRRRGCRGTGRRVAPSGTRVNEGRSRYTACCIVIQ
jgi:integrase